MPRRTRRCRNCHRTGHDRRNCSQLQVQQQQQQPQPQPQQQPVQIHCVLCGSRYHDSYDCPILVEDEVIVPPPPPTPRPRQLSQPSSNRQKINWDTCGNCGLPNDGGTCSCGEKQVAPVPPNEEGIYECTICYTDLKELNKVTTKCGHHYCIDCFLHHFTSGNPSSKNCPMCRADLLEVKTEELQSPPTPVIAQSSFRGVSNEPIFRVMNAMQLYRI